MYINGSFVDYTGENGDFQIELPFGTERVAIYFFDEFMNEFIPKIHVKTFLPSTSGIVYETVIMADRPAAIEINSTEENLVNITTISGDVLGTILIPENAIYDNQGNLYEVGRED